MSIEWKVAYDDGSTFTNQDGEPNDTPPFGVTYINQLDKTPPPANVGRVTVSRWPYYWYRPDKGEWWGGEWDGVLDHLLNRLPFEALLMGRTMSTGEFRQFMEQAEGDPDFPSKSGKHPLEIR